MSSSENGQGKSDMQAELQALIAFHLTGRISGGAFDALAKSDLQPAMLAGYRDLTALRYDFPIVLVRGGGKPVQSLCRIGRWRAQRYRGRRPGKAEEARLPARAGNPDPGRRRRRGLAVEDVGPRGRRHRREKRRSLARQPAPPACRGEGRRRCRRLRQGDAVSFVPARLAELAGSQDAEFPGRYP